MKVCASFLISFENIAENIRFWRYLGKSMRYLRRMQRRAHLWVLKRGEARWEGIPPGRATANSPDLMMQMARAGAGITNVHDHFAQPYVLNGELTPVLPDWTLPATTAWAVFPGRRLMPARTRVFLDALQKEFTGPKCQEQEEKMQAMKRR